MARAAVITGSPGARCDAVEAELRGRGWEVRRAASGPWGPADLDEPARGAEALVHVGLRTPRDADVEERAEAEANAAFAAGRAARDAGVRRFVHLSTVSVYGRPRNLPCAEGEPKLPRSAFERARWRAEQSAWLAFRQGAPLSVLRPTLVYGPTLRGGLMRGLALLALLGASRRHVPIIRRGPVVHVVHLEDVARAAADVVEHPSDADVVGRAFNVGDEAPLPLAEHLAAAVEAMGRSPGRILPYSPRLTALALWLARRIPDRVLLAPLNEALAAAWARLAERTGARLDLAPRVGREMLLWMSADHYYATDRLRDLGWRPRHPISVEALPDTVRALAERRLLPVRGGAAPAPI